MPAPQKAAFENATVRTAFDMGWSTLENGDLINSAEASRFDVFITTDKNLRYQQDLANRTIVIVVLPTLAWPKLKLISNRISAVALNADPGSYLELDQDGGI